MKRFKYLYFTNVLNKPYFNFWFLKKLKGGKEDDGNLLTQPEDYSNGGVDWTWSDMNVSGKGKVTASSSYITDVDIPLKEALVVGEYYTLSIKESVPKIIRIQFPYTTGGNFTQNLGSGTTSITFKVVQELKPVFRLRYMASRGDDVDVTIKDIKLVKAS